MPVLADNKEPFIRHESAGAVIIGFQHGKTNSVPNTVDGRAGNIKQDFDSIVSRHECETRNIAHELLLSDTSLVGPIGLKYARGNTNSLTDLVIESKLNVNLR